MVKIIVVSMRAGERKLSPLQAMALDIQVIESWAIFVRSVSVLNAHNIQSYCGSRVQGIHTVLHYIEDVNTHASISILAIVLKMMVVVSCWLLHTLLLSTRAMMVKVCMMKLWTHPNTIIASAFCNNIYLTVKKVIILCCEQNVSQ